MKKKKNLAALFLFFVLFAAVGAVCGLMIVRHIGRVKTLGQYFLMMAALFAELYLAFFLSLAIHEAGHLVFGLSTGYTFSSFRLGSLMIVRENGKLGIKRLSVSGTGGQCLMGPPDLNDGEFPYVLYNLGGCIFNLLSGILCLLLLLVLPDKFYLDAFVLLLAMFGIVNALVNGIPLNTGLVDNDGKNTLMISKSKEARRAFWVQLKCAQLSSQGVRLKDMPGEWMTVPDDEQMKNSIIAVKAVFACNRLLDMHKIEEAAQLITRIVSDDDYAVCGLHRGMLIGDLVYCSDMLGKSTPRELTQDKMYITVSKKMKQFLSVIRTNYAHALLWEKNEQKADKILEEFEKITKNYPYSSDIESERELIALAKEKTNT